MSFVSWVVGNLSIDVLGVSSVCGESQSMNLSRSDDGTTAAPVSIIFRSHVFCVVHVVVACQHYIACIAVREVRADCKK